MNVRALASVAVAVCLLAAFVGLFRPAVVWSALAAANAGTFALGIAATLAAVACWGEALYRLVRVTDPGASRWRSFAAFGAGTFGKQVLPMGNAGGPAVLAYAVSRDVALPYDRSLAVATVDELAGLVATVVLAGVGVAVLLVTEGAVPNARAIGAALLAVVALVVAFGWLVLYRRQLVDRVVHAAARLLDRAVGRRHARVHAALEPARVAAGLRRYYATIDAVGGDRRTLATAFGLVLLGRFCFTLPLYTSAHALGLHFPLALAVFAVAAGSVAVAVPIPGGLGSVELALAGLLVALTGVDAAIAVAAVVLFRLCTYWFLLVVTGLAALYSAASVRALPTEVETAEESGNTQ